MEKPNLQDITDPSAFLPEPATPWWYWAVAGLVVLLLVSAIVYMLCKPSAAKQRATLLDRARSRLEKLREEAATLPPHITATRISLIIRRYLEAAFKDPALFETNEEFTLRAGALGNVHPDAREAITGYLTKLSQLKYAPSNSEEGASLINEAEQLIARIEINVTPSDA